MIRWFLSKTVRQAGHLHKQVHKILSAQRDILAPKAVEAVEAAMGDLRSGLKSGASRQALEALMAKLEEAGNKWLKPYPNSALRENVEVFLVAIAVAMAIRTFVLQPFKIPTGSMQPTLYGIMPEPMGEQDEVPNRVNRFFTYWLTGLRYIDLKAPADGSLSWDKPAKFLLFNLYQNYRVGSDTAKVWFPDDNLFEKFPNAGFEFKRGETILKRRVISGDHLFVDRLTFNFRRPNRGEIVVFETAGIRHAMVPTNQFYIKRLVGLGGERLRIGEDSHLVIDGKRLDSSTPGFGKVYGWTTLAATNRYVGHQLEPRSDCLFRTPADELVIRPNHYVVMGDNTRSSLDSRYFGDFSRQYVIGKAAFVYWPFTSRFFLGYK